MIVLVECLSLLMVQLDVLLNLNDLVARWRKGVLVEDLIVGEELSCAFIITLFSLAIGNYAFYNMDCGQVSCHVGALFHSRHR